MDDHEANRTLRSGSTRGAAGEEFTDIVALEPPTRNGIVNATERHEFLDILSRSSMLPVVATIWPDIQELKRSGADFTGPLLIETYLQATYKRKEANIESDIRSGTAGAVSYLELPKEVRELLMVCVAWRMAASDMKNTIPRSDINNMIMDIYMELFDATKAAGVKPHIVERMEKFELRHSDKTIVQKAEILTTEVCVAGLLVPDPAGGLANLQFPHKQFYEYLVCKGFLLFRRCESGIVPAILARAAREVNEYQIIAHEENAIHYLAECVGQDVDKVFSYWIRFCIGTIWVWMWALTCVLGKRVWSVRSKNKEELADEKGAAPDIVTRERWEEAYTYFWTVTIMFTSIFFVASLTVWVVTGSAGIITGTDKIVLTVATTLLVASLGSMMIRIIYPGNATGVFVKYLHAMWVRAGQRPEKLTDEWRLIVGTTRAGRVKYPEQAPQENAKVDDFLSPAESLGGRLK